jgi:histidine kinase
MSRALLPRRLRTRLFLSYALVVTSGALAMLLVGTVVTRTVYERRIGGFGAGRGQGQGSRAAEMTATELRTALDESLLPALAAGVLAALVTAALVAAFVGRRLLRPIDEMGHAARRMAAGDYDVRVPVPVETELAALAADVNRLGEHLATTEQRRTHLLGEVTHEMRTPITVIRGQMEGLLDGVVDADEAVFASVAEEAGRLERLVNDLTLLSRVEEGTLHVRHERLDLGAVAAAAVERLRPQFDHAGVALRLVPGPDGAPPALPVRGDLDRLVQVLSNLLGNALEHTPTGGAVTVRPLREGASAVVEVIDTGSGLTAEELDRVFDRFYRAPGRVDTGRPVAAGRGLGLTIARGLARAHGGDVDGASDGRGAGATFRLVLPVDLAVA